MKRIKIKGIITLALAGTLLLGGCGSNNTNKTNNSEISKLIFSVNIKLDEKAKK